VDGPGRTIRVPGALITLGPWELNNDLTFLRKYLRNFWEKSKLGEKNQNVNKNHNCYLVYKNRKMLVKIKLWRKFRKNLSEKKNWKLLLKELRKKINIT